MNQAKRCSIMLLRVIFVIALLACSCQCNIQNLTRVRRQDISSQADSGNGLNRETKTSGERESYENVHTRQVGEKRQESFGDNGGDFVAKNGMIEIGGDNVGYDYKVDDMDVEVGRISTPTSQRNNVIDKAANLEEYRPYPNEAMENEFTNIKDSYPTVLNVKDIISQDSEIIKKEMKAINDEDKMIGGVKGDVFGRAISNSKNITHRHFQQEDESNADQITKELLNMKLGAHGIIQNSIKNHLKVSKESIPSPSPLTLRDSANDIDNRHIPIALQTDNMFKEKLNSDVVKSNLPGKNETFSSIDGQQVLPKDTFKPFFKKVPVKEHKNVKSFNKIQKELLLEMFKRPQIQKKSLQTPKDSVQTLNEEINKIQEMYKTTKKKFAISRIKKDQIKKRTEIPSGEGFAGATSYTDEDGHEMTYTLSKDRLTYDNARRRCQNRHHGDLATLSNVKEQDFIVNNVILEPNEYWIGYDDRSLEGRFEWVDNLPTTYTYWGNMEPDDGANKRRGSPFYHNEDCTIIKSTMEWNDVNCNQKHMFICKKTVKKTVTLRPIFSDLINTVNQDVHADITLNNFQRCSIQQQTGDCVSDDEKNKDDDLSSEVTPGGNGGVSKDHVAGEQHDEPETANTDVAMIKIRQTDHASTSPVISQYSNPLNQLQTILSLYQKKQGQQQQQQQHDENQEEKQQTQDNPYSSLGTILHGQLDGTGEQKSIIQKDGTEHFHNKIEHPKYNKLLTSFHSFAANQQTRNNEFIPDQTVVKNLCSLTCMNLNFNGCKRSCRNTLNSMKFVQFLNSLKNLRNSTNLAENKPLENYFSKEIIDKVEGNLVQFYKALLTRAGYNNPGHAYSNMLDHNSVIQKDGFADTPINSWKLFKSSKMLDEYNKVLNEKDKTMKNLEAPGKLKESGRSGNEMDYGPTNNDDSQGRNSLEKWKNTIRHTKNSPFRSRHPDVGNIGKEKKHKAHHRRRKYDSNDDKQLAPNYVQMEHGTKEKDFWYPSSGSSRKIQKNQHRSGHINSWTNLYRTRDKMFSSYTKEIPETSTDGVNTNQFENFNQLSMDEPDTTLHIDTLLNEQMGDIQNKVDAVSEEVNKLFAVQ